MGEMDIAWAVERGKGGEGGGPSCFRIPRAEARLLLQRFWSRRVPLLAPALADMAAQRLTSVLLPFWRFEVDTGSARGAVREREVRGSGGGTRYERVDEGNIVEESGTKRVMEVFAGYEIPPFAANVVLRRGTGGAVEGLESIEALATPGPLMGSEVAWVDAQRQFEASFKDKVLGRARLRGRGREIAVTSVSLDLKQARTPLLVGYPAYLFDYKCEQRYTQSGDRREAVPFRAVISGLDGEVHAVEHVSTNRARVAGGALGAMGGGMLGLVSPEATTIAAEMVAGGAISALLAGSYATRRPMNAWEQVEKTREDRDQAELSAWDSVYDNLGLPLDWEEHETYSRLLETLEWRRWSQPDAWFGWIPHERQEWAEQLWKRNMLSAQQRHESRIAQAEAERQAADEAARDKRKRERFGDAAFRSAHHHHHQSNRAVDPHGYFKVLGLDSTDQPGLEEIKAAFRREALRFHPDTQSHGRNSLPRRGENSEDFRKLLTAYQALIKGVRRE